MMTRMFAVLLTIAMGCARQAPPQECVERSPIPAETEADTQALAAAVVTGRAAAVARRKANPAFPDKMEEHKGNLHLLRSVACRRYGYYKEAAAEIGLAYEFIPDVMASMEKPVSK